LDISPFSLKMKFVIGILAIVAFSAIVSAADVDNSKPAIDNRKLARFEQDKKEVTSFLNARNIIKTVVKLLFGTTEESSATSRQLLSVVVKVLDMVRTSFGARARSTGSGRGIRDAFDDATLAGVSMTRGFIKSYLAKDNPTCAQRHLCEASKDAVRDGRELGYLVAQFGGYASSYLFENQKSSPFNNSYEAVKRGRSGEDCAKIYATCNETDI